MSPVLITRAAPDADDFAKLCKARGLTPILAPVMTIDIDCAEIELNGVSALAFTSANGVRAFVANCDMRGLPVFAVGPVTAAAARAAGFQDVRTAGGDVESLAYHVGAEIGAAGGTVLHIAGKDRAGDLVSLLGVKKISARRRTLYSAKPVTAITPAGRAAIVAAPPLWVSLFSPRTANLFLAMAAEAGVFDCLKNCKAACLSEAVAQKAATAGWGAIEVAADRTAQALADMMAA
ncbi:MAG: uroporphyrinogen-III synthase [Pseudomonadota bacterium]